MHIYIYIYTVYIYNGYSLRRHVLVVILGAVGNGPGEEDEEGKGRDKEDPSQHELAPFHEPAFLSRALLAGRVGAPHDGTARQTGTQLVRVGIFVV